MCYHWKFPPLLNSENIRELFTAPALGYANNLEFWRLVSLSVTEVLLLQGYSDACSLRNMAKTNCVRDFLTKNEGRENGCALRIDVVVQTI